MIANLITTLMLALGVASGSYQSETCNAFKHVEERQEKPIQKAVIENNYNLVFNNAGTYDDINTKYYSYKQYLWETYENNGTNPTDNGGVNVLLDPFLITNTTYTFSALQDGKRNIRNYMFLKFTNYTNSVQTLTITSTMTLDVSQSSNLIRAIYESTDTSIDQAIDVTLNASTFNTVDSIVDNAEKTLIYNNPVSWTPSTNQTIGTESPQITLNGAETKYIILYYNNRTNGYSDYGWLYNNNLEITGRYIQQEITQEIVDIPNLMFTILTLPFTFYSTAFNLTIFPNTPYQLNIGNLILTIIAALILLYLIKKVIK